jgi:hypothetical protein
VVVDPSREHGCLHTHHTRFRYFVHPNIWRLPARGEGSSLLNNGSISLAYAIADHLFVYVKPNLVHIHHASLHQYYARIYSFDL